mgnify:CR=1 FL=1
MAADLWLRISRLGGLQHRNWNTCESYSSLRKESLIFRETRAPPHAEDAIVRLPLPRVRYFISHLCADDIRWLPSGRISGRISGLYRGCTLLVPQPVRLSYREAVAAFVSQASQPVVVRAVLQASSVPRGVVSRAREVDSRLDQTKDLRKETAFDRAGF